MTFIELSEEMINDKWENEFYKTLVFFILGWLIEKEKNESLNDSYEIKDAFHKGIEWAKYCS